MLWMATALGATFVFFPNLDYVKETAIVRFEADKPVPPDRVIEAAKDAGYGAELALVAP